MKFSAATYLSSCSFYAVFYVSLVLFSCCGFANVQSNQSLSPEPQKNQLFQTLMAGGGLKVCTSHAPENCLSGELWTDAQQRKSEQYRLNRESFEAVVKTAGFLSLDDRTKSRLKTLFAHFYANPINVNSPEEIRLAFKNTNQDFDAGSLFSNLPNDVYYAILDFAQHANPDSVVVNFSNTKTDATKAIFREFVRQANSKRREDKTLELSFVTAAQRNPLAEVPYYKQIIEQAAQAELSHQNYSVRWLPIDESLVQAIENKSGNADSCESLKNYRQQNQLFNAQKRYPLLTQKQQELCQQPKRLEQYLASSHGVFITDGDAMRILRVFRNAKQQNTVYQNILQKRWQAGELFLAGSGVGATVMAGGIFENRPIPMITGGTSDVALVRGAFALTPAPFGCEKDGNCPFGLLEDDLTYESRGGLGSFNLGVLDYDLSQQGRQARLTVLAASAKLRFGFGIDENTALLYGSSPDGDSKMKVVGENGVLIVDMRDAIVKTQSGKHQIIGLSHYLNSGDSIIWSNRNKELSFNLAGNSEKLTSKTMILPRNKGEFRRNIVINCGTTSFHRWTENNIAWLVNPTPDTEFYRHQLDGRESCSYNNLLFGIEN